MRATCSEFGAELVAFNGETRVHLLVQYPPSLAISTLVQRLNGRTAYALHREFTGACVRARADTSARRPTSPSPAEARHCPSSTNTSTAKHDHCERRAAPPAITAMAQARSKLQGMRPRKFRSERGSRCVRRRWARWATTSFSCQGPLPGVR